MSTEVRIENLVKHYPVSSGIFKRAKESVHAIDNVSFEIGKKETLGLVGESGCGKTTLARLILRLAEPTSGKIFFRDKNILDATGKDMKRIRRDMQIVFQNPLSSLNPMKSIRQILSLPYTTYGVRGDELQSKVANLLEDVGLCPADLYIDRFPHELSGGQRQRVGLARAIALNPSFIVADEPVSALDMSIRAQILNLIKRLQERHDLTILFITHELAVVRSICCKVAVMYLGKLVELADVGELFSVPLHPYTEAIISSTPMPNPAKARSRKRIILKGEIPSPINPPTGCRFHTRCLYNMPKCSKEEPEMVNMGGRHMVSCHLRS